MTYRCPNGCCEVGYLNQSSTGKRDGRVYYNGELMTWPELVRLVGKPYGTLRNRVVKGQCLVAKSLLMGRPNEEKRNRESQRLAAQFLRLPVHV